MCVLAIFLANFCCPGLFAQERIAAAPPTTIEADKLEQERAWREVQEELTQVEHRWYGLMRVRWSYPQKFSAGFGAMFVQQTRGADCSTGCILQGWHFEVEPGMYGIQGSAGWGRLVGETGGTERLLHTVYFGWAVRGVVMRTWGDSPLTPQSQTLAGIEGNLSIIRLNFSLGVLRPLSAGSSRDWVYSIGLAWGF